MQRPDSRPSIGSLVHVHMPGALTPYLALVVGHPHTRRYMRPAVEVVSKSVGGRPYDVFAEFVREVV
jgi:hypothetical protein